MNKAAFAASIFVLFVFILGAGTPTNAEKLSDRDPNGFGAVEAPDADYEHELLQQTVTLWADGRGDVILTPRLRNLSRLYWSNFTWYFDWFPGDYSNIRAFDALGPLNYTTSRSGTRIYVTVYFRNVVPIGSAYEFNLAITIGNMASGSGNDWRANWYTRPVNPVQEFVKGVTFPSNATIESISPPVSSRSGNYLEWRESNTPENWEHTIDVEYTLSNQTDVPLFLQTNRVLVTPDAPWSGATYGNYPAGDTFNTIDRWGCYMVSAAMIIDYWAEEQQVSFDTDPGAFNRWLRANNGYDPGNGVIHAKIVEYADENGVLLRNTGYEAQRNDSILDTYLRSGNPVIIGVGDHYVAATAKTSVNGVDTYAINDPIYGRTTLYERYDNAYESILLLSGTEADLRSLRISAHSPVELVITDPLGRRVGYDPSTGTSWDEIPGAVYVVESIAADGDPNATERIDSKFALIYTPVDGNYIISTYGTGDGDYILESAAADWDGDVTKSVTRGTAEAGSLDTTDLEYDSETGLHHWSVSLPVFRH